MGTEDYGRTRVAIRALEPERIAARANRQFQVGLIASSTASLRFMYETLVPPHLSDARREELAALVRRVDPRRGPAQFDVVLCEEELIAPRGAFPFYAAAPRQTAREVLDARPKLDLALARSFPLFRQPVIARTIRDIAKENALFSLLAALPGLIPNTFGVPLEAGGFAPDSAVITVNQVRMAFLIAAASDQKVSFEAQSAQIGAIVGGAVAWRVLASELAKKIPYAEGIIPKALVAYAGTYTVGVGLERFYRVGYGLTQEERTATYDRAMAQARNVIDSLLALRRPA